MSNEQRTLDEMTLVSDGRIDTRPHWRALYETWCERTEKAYDRLGHSLGFDPPIVSSVRAFAAKPRLLLMGLNPAGSRDYPKHRGKFRYEERDAHLGTSWNGFAPPEAPLQGQVSQLLRNVQRRVVHSGPLELFARHRIVTASFVPFRSRGEADLHDRPASIEFGRSLWNDVLRVLSVLAARCSTNCHC